MEPEAINEISIEMIIDILQIEINTILVIDIQVQRVMINQNAIILIDHGARTGMTIPNNLITIPHTKILIQHSLGRMTLTI